MPKKIVVDGLSQKSIRNAIKELEDYKRRLNEKTEELKRRVAEEIGAEALKNFSTAVIDDTVRSGMRGANVDVTVQHSNGVSFVIANGEDAVWVEFGSGVFHNSAVGSSPNPYGKELGLTIGSYGKGRGSRQVWGYYAEEGEKSSLTLTRGTPAQMPLFLAVSKVAADLMRIAKEVFNGD